MASPKINKDATRLIDEALAGLTSPYREICIKLRQLVHKADPDITEDWKWGPNFNHNGMVCNVWGFKKHASIVFFRGTQMKDTYNLFNQGEANKGSRAIQFTDIKQVNEKQIIAYVKEAVKLNLSGTENPRTIAKEVTLPEELTAWFTKNAKAKAVFDALNYTARRELAQSVLTAKRPETREKRIKLLKDKLKSG